MNKILCLFIAASTLLVGCDKKNNGNSEPSYAELQAGFHIDWKG